MDRDAYMNWVEQLESYQLIDFANHWGQKVADYSSIGGNELKKLQCFEQYLIDYFNGNVANASADDGDAQYDNLKQNGDL